MKIYWELIIKNFLVDSLRGYNMGFYLKLNALCKRWINLTILQATTISPSYKKKFFLKAGFTYLLMVNAF